MTPKIKQLCLVLLGVASTLASAVACAREQPIAPADSAAASSAPRDQQIVVVEPVLVSELGRGSRMEYRPRTLRLTPVLKGEPIDYSDPIFAHNDLLR